MKIVLMSISFFMFLSGCASRSVVVNREPIYCQNSIKTNGDMAICLAEYVEKY